MICLQMLNEDSFNSFVQAYIIQGHN